MLETSDFFLPQFLLAVSALQGGLFVVDEGVCHRRRKLGKWESLGHPVDALFLFIPLWIAGYWTANIQLLGLFVGLSLLSCIIVTKDEWLHAKECDGLEMWIHSLMFVMHPLVLGIVGLCWWLGLAEGVRKGLPFLVAGVGLYQLIYWNFVHVRSHK